MVWPFKKRHDDVAPASQRNNSPGSVSSWTTDTSPWTTDNSSWTESQKQRIAQRKKNLIAGGLKDLTSKFNFLGDLPFAHGVMSSIYFGQLADGSLVALKLQVEMPSNGVASDRTVENEAALWSCAMGHENVLPLLGFATFKGSIGFVSPWIKEGNIGMYLSTHPQADKIKLLLDIARGLSHVHSKGIVYSILRMTTVVVSENGTAMLSSFLFANWARDGKANGDELAPWAGEASGYQSDPESTFEDDLVTFGTLMMDVLPSSTKQRETLSNLIVLNALPSNLVVENLPYPVEIWTLVQRCWSLDESARPTLAEIISTLENIISRSQLSSVNEAATRPRRSVLKDISSEITKLSKHPITGGGYCDLYLGERLGKERVALKLVRLFGSTDTDKEGARKRFLAEARIWAELDHPKILKFYGICDYGTLSLFMVSPFLANGNILRYLVEINPNANRYQLLLDAAEGLKYLHSRTPPVIHGDLKGANILVSDLGHAVLADFGLARLSLEMTMTNLRDSGSPRWMAPELFSFMDIEDTPHKTVMSDVYAFGQVISEVLSNRPPFFNMRENVHVIVQLANQRRSPRPTGPVAEKWITDRVWEYVQKCTAPDPLVRPDILTVLSELHQVFRQV